MVAIACKTDLIINLSWRGRNHVQILGRVIKALVRGGRGDLVADFRKEALAAKSYDGFIAVVKSYVEVV